MKYTPGPWMLTKSEYDGSVHYSIHTVDKRPEHPWSEKYIAIMCGSLGEKLHWRRPEEYRDDPRIETDAYLLTAAPDLFEALSAIMVSFYENEEGLCMECGEALGTGDKCQSCQLWTKAQQALAKAQGSEKVEPARTLMDGQNTLSKAAGRKPKNESIRL